MHTCGWTLNRKAPLRSLPPQPEVLRVSAHGSSPCVCASCVSVRRDSGSSLKAPIQGFEPLQSIQQLQAGLSHVNAGLRKPFRVLDREFDSINRNAGLIGHLKLKR